MSSSNQSKGSAPRGSTVPQVFRDLRRHNERRARAARLLDAQRKPLPQANRATQRQRARRSGRAG